MSKKSSKAGRTPFPALLVTGVLLAFSVRVAHANEGGASLFVRGDSDQTVVISPRAAVRTTIEDRTQIDAAYAADIWTSASIDIRTAATAPVTEQRDQIDASVRHEFDDVSLGASYYHSSENDYWSHGVTLSASQDFNNNATTLDQSLRYVFDTVGRSGDQSFERPLHSASARLAYTQILSPEALMQAVWEGTYREGYQASPYRYVGIGGDGMCAGTAVLCLPEIHPDTRIRNAFVLRGRYAFSPQSSAGLGYRFYIDDWGVISHTAQAQVAWTPSEGSVITLRYRFYTQSAASFYLARYPLDAGQPRFATRDRELSPMFSNRAALSYQGRLPLDDTAALRLAVALGGTIFVYSDFVGLDEVYALDGTVALTLEL